MVRKKPSYEDLQKKVGDLKHELDFIKSKHAHQASATSGEHPKTNGENLAESLFHIDYEGNILDRPENLFLKLGYALKEIKEGMNLFTFMLSDDHGPLRQEIHDIQAGKTIHFNAYPLIDRHDTKISLKICLHPLGGKDQSGSLPVKVIRVIDKTGTYEDENNLLLTAIEQVSEPIEITDSDGHLIYVNSAFESLTGYTRKEALGRNMSFLSSGAHNEEFYQEMWRTVKSGSSWHGVFINRHKNGAIYEADTSITPVSDHTGKYTHFVGMRRDITTVEKIEEQLQRVQKLEAIGTLAGGIAHDFNNILAAILGYTELSLVSGTTDAYVQDNLNEIYKAGTRAKNMIRQILTYSRETEEQLIPVRPASIIQDTLKMLRPTLPTNIEFQVNLRADGEILADATQIQQLIMNICTNAFHAMTDCETGVLKIDLSEITLGKEDAQIYPNLEIGPYLKIEISDTGIGMDSYTQNRIFDPYFTTKESGIGTGLGLSVVLGIVHHYRGTIKVHSELGRGTTFTVLLPRTSEVQEIEYNEGEILPSGNERILLVDDEEMLVDMGRQMLQALGYTVSANISSFDALRTFKADPNHFDLVITDYSMPVMTGIKLASEIRKIKPDIPIILCSGYSEKTSTSFTLRQNMNALLSKPYDLKAIATLVRKVLENPEKSFL